MSINFSKSCCIRIGPVVTGLVGLLLLKAYLVIVYCGQLTCVIWHFGESRNMKCSLDTCKGSCYRAANSIFEKNWANCIGITYFTPDFYKMYLNSSVWVRISLIVPISAEITGFCN